MSVHRLYIHLQVGPLGYTYPGRRTSHRDKVPRPRYRPAVQEGLVAVEAAARVAAPAVVLVVARAGVMAVARLRHEPRSRLSAVGSVV